MQADNDQPTGVNRAWWESRWAMALACLAVTVPLFYPPVPPMPDVPGHMGRFAVLLDTAQVTSLQRYYGTEWSAMGNMGVDVVMMLLGPLMGVEAATKLVLLLIPPITAAGFFWVAKEVHGRIPPTTYFAVPLALSHPYLYGFANYTLSMALAFPAFALWLRMTRANRVVPRALVFVPISLILYFAHAFGWGMFGLLAFSAEFVRYIDKGERWPRAGLHAALQALVLALPLVAMVVWHSRVPGVTIDWFEWNTKLIWFLSIFRDRWMLLDLLSLVAALMVLFRAWREPAVGFSRMLLLPAVILTIVYILLPRTIVSSSYTDMRLAPYALATYLLAIRFNPPRNLNAERVMALLGAVFLAVRVVATTASLAIASNDQQAKLAALDHVEEGARVASFVGTSCDDFWALSRNLHIGGYVMVRRHGFSNDQWLMEGQNLLTITYREPGFFAYDRSEEVTPNSCPNAVLKTVDQSLTEVPREAFDYVWLVDVPAFDPGLVKGMAKVWSGAGSELYRIAR